MYSYALFANNVRINYNINVIILTHMLI